MIGSSTIRRSSSPQMIKLPPNPVITWAAVSLTCLVTFACGETSQSVESVTHNADCSELRPDDTCQVTNPSMGQLWENLHAGRYDNISNTINGLKMDLETNAEDIDAHKSIGFLRTWQLGEMYRSEQPDLGQLIQGLQEASDHFAVALDQENDPRLIIFKSTNEYMAAKQVGNETLEMETRRQFIDAVETWPELNYFVGGTMLSIFSQPGDGDFERALDYMWRNLDVCAGETVSRSNPLPQMRALIKDVPRTGVARACSNSWIAPHSFEGFWLFFGDLLTKSGDLTLARVMYEFVKTAQDYDGWRFKDVLEERLANLEYNQMNFRRPVAEQDPKYHPVAEWSCTVCHQR